MNLDHDLDGVQTAVLASARAYFSTRLDMETVRNLINSPRGFDDQQWRIWTGLDWHSLLVPDQLGGAGLGAREFTLLCREAGRVCSPTPFVFSAVATWALAAALPDSDLVGSLIDGSRRATMTTGGLFHPARTPHESGTEHVSVLYAEGADVVVMEGSDRIPRVVGVEELDTSVVPEPYMDPTRRWYKISARDIDAAPSLEISPEDWTRAGHLANLAIAADSVGVGIRAMTMAVEHARTREQFGRPIGTYQGVAHRCAQMAFQLQGAWTLVWAAAEMLDGVHEIDSDVEIAVAMAKAHASDAGVSVTESALQVHGGLGFSAEHDSHLLVRRARSNAYLWRSAEHHRAQVAAHLLAQT